MNDYFEILENLILDPNTSARSYRNFNQELNNFISSNDGIETVKANILRRLSIALEEFVGEREDETGTSDIAVLLRQAIRTYHRPFRIPSRLWHLIRNRASYSGLLPTNYDDEITTIRAQEWNPNWLTHTKGIDKLENRRHIEPVIGDGNLASMTKNKLNEYISMGQKLAVDAVLFASPGQTVIISLPTGGGKSLCFTLPAWIKSQGGTRVDGTTIVLVPTVSLALDQHQHVKEFFTGAVDDTYFPKLLIGNTPPEERELIYQGLRDGTLPILFTSPEALLNGKRLYDAVLKAAENKTLNWFVIDEAHIVDSWGGGFRTEFQLLSTYRRKLLSASDGTLKTLLLSATLSNKCSETLKSLFSEEENSVTIFANQLRPEISYWFSKSQDEKSRRDHVLDALYNLPRPAIVYVTKPDQAQDLWEFLQSQGFDRIASFTGDTEAIERQSIMRDWNRDKIDLMIATSAFGLGVDKQDIRTVIHASIPESIDRFYQEVGRGGRDGFSSISLTCFVNTDFELALSMHRASHISIEKAWPRWNAMWESGKPINLNSSSKIINIDTPPKYNPEITRGDKHRNWNEHVLLLMQRAGLISIEDTQPPETAEEAETDIGLYRKREWIQIRLLSTDISFSRIEFENEFGTERKLEKQLLELSINRMLGLANDYSQHGSEYCIGNIFSAIYPGAGIACGGCPNCHDQEYKPYAIGLEIKTEYPINHYEPVNLLIPKVNNFVKFNKSINAVCNGTLTDAEQIIELIGTLFSIGFQQLIIPTEYYIYKNIYRNLINSISNNTIKPHRILLDDWVSVSESDFRLFQLPTIIVYSADNIKVDQVFKVADRNLAEVTKINILHRSQELLNQFGLFVDRVNGTQWSVNKLNAHLLHMRDQL